MGTSSLICFIYKNKSFHIYNHFDSYPEGLGIILINQLIKLVEIYKIEDIIKMLDDINILELNEKNTSNGKFSSIYDIINSNYVVDEKDIYVDYNYIIDFNKQLFINEELNWNMPFNKLKKYESLLKTIGRNSILYDFDYLEEVFIKYKKCIEE